MFLQSPPKLILASTSVYRRELLARLGLPFECRAPGADETSQPGEAAAALAARLARAKAWPVAAADPAAWVIGSDQVAVLGPAADESILGKPGSAARCMEQLRACSGHTVTFLTAVCVLRGRDASAHEFVDRTVVAFRALCDLEIERYVARESPLDCAGGFKSEGLGISLFESIDNRDPTALIGLPLIRLAATLRACGYPLP
ncbi:MAG TPA: Maf family nucleotide pyrophosphatase [Steroidobacteraceae bacterium]|nr:Maf family nucleotide pyrophosphatase [Steroidobacteraceae bacterium]